MREYRNCRPGRGPRLRARCRRPGCWRSLAASLVVCCSLLYPMACGRNRWSPWARRSSWWAATPPDRRGQGREQEKRACASVSSRRQGARPPRSAATTLRARVHFRWSASAGQAPPAGQGPAGWKIRARNASWAGSSAAGPRPSTSPSPPASFLLRVEVVTTQHYVNQAGCDMVVDRASRRRSKAASWRGRRSSVGSRRRGGATRDIRFVIFADPYDAPAGTPAGLRARNEAATRSLANFHQKVHPKGVPLAVAARGRRAPGQGRAPDREPEAHPGRGPGRPPNSYPAINRDLRKAKTTQLAEMVSKSQERSLCTPGRSSSWGTRGRGRPSPIIGPTPTRAARSPSGPSRVRPGQHFPCSGARLERRHAGDGRLLRHRRQHRRDRRRLRPAVPLRSLEQLRGQGLRRRQARPGRSAQRRQRPRRGDHLHYSMVLQSAQVDLKEWRDPHWIKDRITSKLEQSGRGGGSKARLTGKTARRSPPSGSSACRCPRARARSATRP